MTNKQRNIYLCIGPLLFLFSSFFFIDILGEQGSKAIGTLLWMVFWWVTRPIHMTVTAMLPILVNAIFSIAPMDSIIKQYSSSSLILIFGTGLLSMSWENTGLDKRIALKALSLIGPSMQSQIIVWFCASVILSTFMPNVAVCALYCPIAVAMLKAAGYSDMKTCKQATIILLAIGWGAGIGGVGSPLGGAMNITAISYLQTFTNSEFMYIDWIIRMVPYMILVTLSLLTCMIAIGKKCEPIQGSKEYFVRMLNELPKMSNDEKISGILFVFAVVLSFLRPLYANLLPDAQPAYVFLILGFVMFILTRKDKQPFITWDQAEKESLWGMMFLFGGGVALGSMINESNAAVGIAQLIGNIQVNNAFVLIVIFSFVAVLMSELTNSTVCAAVLTPIVLTTTSNMGLNPIPFWFTLCIAMNAEFLLPVSVRAIPVSYGLDTQVMFKKGIGFVILRFIIGIFYAYLCLKFIPGFGTLSF